MINVQEDKMEIKAEGNKPYVKLDEESCTLTIKGHSYPEHPSIFYDPILRELIDCSEYMKGATVTIKLALEIWNSSSEKHIFNIVKCMYDLSTSINIDWYYEEGDEDMKEDGCLFRDVFEKSTFRLIPVENIRAL